MQPVEAFEFSLSFLSLFCLYMQGGFQWLRQHKKSVLVLRAQLVPGSWEKFLKGDNHYPTITPENSWTEEL